MCLDKDVCAAVDSTLHLTAECGNHPKCQDGGVGSKQCPDAQGTQLTAGCRVVTLRGQVTESQTNDHRSHDSMGMEHPGKAH